MPDLPPDGRRLADIPIFVLTSRRTASGGEEFAYNLKTRKRALIIGEPTWGGANPGGTHPLPSGLRIFIPTGRAINPVTKTNWEGTGVAPDVPADQDKAFDIAFEKAKAAAAAAAPNRDGPGMIPAARLEKLLEKPPCLEGYRTHQTGFLSRIDPAGGERIEKTFTMETMKIPSDGVQINGWLYLPLGEGKVPLIVLTNGGGDGSLPIRNLSDWIAPILAHCGIAAFVHDKRGTGGSGGVYADTTYKDYVDDAGNCAIALSKHPRVNPDLVGILGGSEGGRIAILTASRFPIVKFAVSFAGPVTDAVEDRIYAQTGELRRMNIPEAEFPDVLRMHEKSIRAWGSGDVAKMNEVGEEILALRKQGRRFLPVTKEETDTDPRFAVFRPTWYSLAADYVTELGRFRKMLLAVYGEEDPVVDARRCVEILVRSMELSGNAHYSIAILPKCGHAPVNTETKRMIRIDYIILNWLRDNVAGWPRS